MFSIFLVAMVSWCVYIAGMAMITLLGDGDYNYHEDKWWSDVFLKTERLLLCVYVLVVATYQNAHSTSKMRIFLGSKDILAGLHNFKLFEG